MTEFEFTGKTVDEAIEEGLAQLNLTREQAEITILEEPVKGLIRSKKAKVKVEKKKSDGIRAVEFIDELIEKMSFHATAELAEENEKVIINLITTNSSSVIGYRGEVLDAFQTLAGAIANIGREDYRRVVVDCENYRGKREDTLKNLALRLAEKAVEKGRKVSLEPMNPYERRIIHSALAENTNVKTVSEGKEPNRFIAIIPNNMRPYEKRDRFNGDRKDFRGGNRSGTGFNRDRNAGGTGYNRDRNASGTGYNRDRNASGTGFNRDANASGTGYNRDRNASGTGFNRDANASGTGYNRDRNAGGTGYNRDRNASGTGYNRDRNASGTGYNRDRTEGGTGYNRDRNGDNRDRRPDGFSKPPQKKTSTTFGTYLGNSLKKDD